MQNTAAVTVQPVAQPMRPGYGAPPVNMQQMPVWMPAVTTIPNCPPGLEYLTQLDQVLIKQEVQVLEVVTVWECKNKYQICNNQGQQCYYAFEESGVCCRQCCGSKRAFKIFVTDNSQRLSIIIERPFKCCSGCNWCAHTSCFQDEVTVTANDGSVCGYVRQACSCIRPRYMILDHNKDPQYEILGPLCPCTLCNTHVNFPVTQIGTGQVIAIINKQWSGVLKEVFTDSDNFGITFPMHLDVRIKATLIGCVFLIDFMYFEDPKNKDGMAGGLTANTMF